MTLKVLMAYPVCDNLYVCFFLNQPVFQYGYLSWYSSSIFIFLMFPRIPGIEVSLWIDDCFAFIPLVGYQFDDVF